LFVVLIRSFAVLLGVGDIQSAEEHADWLISYAQSHSLGPRLTAGYGFERQLAILCSEPTRGVENPKRCLKDLHAARYELLIPQFNISLAQGLGAIGRVTQGVALIDETIQYAEASRDLCYMPEILPVKANLLLSMPHSAGDKAEEYLRLSLDWSPRQGARAWELRAAFDLAVLLVRIPVILNGQSVRS
jgi:hypothetical protein